MHAYTLLRSNVPQESVLGPQLFLLYTADVATIAHGYSVSVHCYADDTQLNASCSAVDGLTTTTQLLRCIDDIDCWMSSNRLKLNADKIQFIWLGPALQLDKVGDVRLRVGGVDISSLDHVCDLGVMLD